MKTLSPVSHARMLSVEATADQLDISAKSVRRLIASGALHACRIGRLLRISQDDLKLYLIKQRS